ncbi:MAG TPA: hypothetical protein VI893_11205 [Thermoplasmata archaeon]|nr:hypothetical protein [Thermoplasmata archaeon]
MQATGSAAGAMQSGIAYGKKQATPAEMGALQRIRFLFSALAMGLAQDVRKSSVLRKMPPADAKYAKEIAELKRDGMTVIPDYLPPERCDELRERVLGFVAQFSRTTELPTGTKVVYRDQDAKYSVDTGMVDVFNIDLSVPGLEPIKSDPMMTEMVSGACGKPVKVKFLTSYVNRGIKQTRGYHIDTISTTEFKAFLYLSDVPDESYGPYTYAKGTHGFSLRKYANIARNIITGGYSVSDMGWVPLKRVMKFIALKGTLAIADQNGFHRGWPQADGRVRVVVVIDFDAVHHQP